MFYMYFIVLPTVKFEIKMINCGSRHLLFGWGLCGNIEYGVVTITLHYTRFLCLRINIYLPTQWSRVLLGKLTGFQLAKKFPTFYGT